MSSVCVPIGSCASSRPRPSRRESVVRARSVSTGAAFANDSAAAAPAPPCTYARLVPRVRHGERATRAGGSLPSQGRDQPPYLGSARSSVLPERKVAAPNHRISGFPNAYAPHRPTHSHHDAPARASSTVAARVAAGRPRGDARSTARHARRGFRPLDGARSTPPPRCARRRRGLAPGAAVVARVARLVYADETGCARARRGVDADGGGYRRAGARALLHSAGARARARRRRALVARLDGDGDGRVSWADFKAAVDAAAEVVDRQVLPISAPPRSPSSRRAS